MPDIDRAFVLPDDPLLAPYNGDKPAPRALNSRLRRAERAGRLPPRVYFSHVRFGYRRAELEAALERLPTSYADTIDSGSGAASVVHRQRRRTEPARVTGEDAPRGLTGDSMTP